jgi:putative PEP-CTERM system histidine kinase
MRWQIKLVMVGLAVLFAARIYTSTQAVLYSAMDVNHDILNSGALLVACLLTGMSLLRTGGGKVDVYPSPEVIQKSFTVLIAGTYLLTVGLIAKMVSWIGGSREFPVLALFILFALTLLTLLLLSDRLRQRGQRFLARHFRRPLYDYRKVWSTFTERTAPKMDERELCRTVVDWISETLNVLSVSIWLTDRPRQRFWLGAATVEVPMLDASQSLKSEDLADLMDGLEQQPDPVDLEVNQEGWAMLLRRLHPDIFAKGGHRICASLLAGGELQGVLVLGDRVGGLAFSPEDDDLTKCVSDQVGSLLLKIRLACRLFEAKEMEAMQTMAAFLVHDLKNTASGLSLMLQNLPRHFENPEFRQDALKTLAANVAHINDLIQRVNSLREGLILRPREFDLGELVECAVRECNGGGRIRWEPGENLRLVFDPEQIHKVLKNLLLNALEAVGKTGDVRVKSGFESECAWVEVADNGCGISQEFLNRSLFRPFQTTKKNGIGIGLFHSKMIVDAHRGRLEVSSEVGKGTRFRLSLPIRSVPIAPSVPTYAAQTKVTAPIAAPIESG